MKINDIVNLIKFHYQRDEESFSRQVFDIAKDFENDGDIDIARHIEALLSPNYSMSFQSAYYSSDMLEIKSTIMKNPIYLPPSISNDIKGIINCIESKNGISKFLFSGRPGTGKTEVVKFISNKLDKKMYVVNMTSLIDCQLGQTLKNIEKLFSTISNIVNHSDSLFLFDELDIIALNRIDSNDVREMGRATSLFLKCLDNLPSSVLIFATTNLGDKIDKALKRRFDYIVDFDSYTKNDIVSTAVEILKEYKKSFQNSELVIFKKIFQASNKEISPSDIRNIIRISVAFSKNTENFEYLQNIFKKLYSDELLYDFVFLKKTVNLTLRESEILTGKPKSTISRLLAGR